MAINMCNEITNIPRSNMIGRRTGFVPFHGDITVNVPIFRTDPIVLSAVMRRVQIVEFNPRGLDRTRRAIGDPPPRYISGTDPVRSNSPTCAVSTSVGYNPFTDD